MCARAATTNCGTADVSALEFPGTMLSSTVSEVVHNLSAFARWRAATLAPFKQRAFAVFWLATVVSSFGSLIQTVGASWLMTTLAPSPLMIALVQTAGALPFFFLSLVAGALADIYDRRKLMLMAQLCMLSGASLLAYLTWAGQITPWLLLGFTFLMGAGSATYAPVWQASISEQVARQYIPAAVTANALGFNFARSTGPAIGGVLVAAFGATIAFVCNAASYLGIVATLLWWKPAAKRAGLPPEPLGAAIASGLRYVLLSPPLVAILVRCGAFTIAAASLQALMPVVARDLLGGGARTYGFLLGTFGIGAMAGALASALLRARYSSEALLRTMSVVSCVAAVGIGLSHWLIVTALLFALGGAVWMLGMSNFNIAAQLSSPRWVAGRAVASYQTVAFGGFALGSWIWGQVAHSFGVRSAMCAGGAAALVSLLISRRVRVRVAHHDGLDPHDAVSVASPQLDIQDSSGPIVVTVEYRVLPANATTFIAIVNELGRIRRRDGARNWSVCQDIDNPELWTERFESPTWLEHLRRQTRPTKSDQRVREKIATLVEGGRGAVRRHIGRPPGSEPLGVALRPIEAIASIPLQN